MKFVDLNKHTTMLSELSEDEVMVYVVRKPGASVSAAELVHFAVEHMNYYMVPRFIEFIDALPKTATEKIEKYKLKQDAQARRSLERAQALVVLHELAFESQAPAPFWYFTMDLLEGDALSTLLAPTHERQATRSTSSTPSWTSATLAPGCTRCCASFMRRWPSNPCRPAPSGWR